MDASIGSIIRSGREKKGLTRDQLAKKLDISPEYLGFLETDYPVTLSDRVVKSLARKGIKVPAKKQEAHNDRSRAYYRKYRKKRAKK